MKLSLISKISHILRPVKCTLPLPVQDVKSVLILRYDALGDAILSTPVWRAIKASNPNIHVGVAGSRRNIALLEWDNTVDSTYQFSRGFTPTLIRDLWKARKIKWDIVINLYFHDKTRGAILAKIAAPHGVSVTSVREKKDKYLALYSAVGERPSNSTPMVQQNLMVLKEVIDLPSNILNGHLSMPDFPEAANAYMQTFDTVLHRTGKSDYIIINTDASQIYKEWGIENSTALARLVISKYPQRHVFLSCAPSRSEPLRKYLANEQDGISFLDAPTIIHLAVAIRHARATVSPDTSVIHFSSAQHVPVLGLYLEPNEFLPYETPNRVLFAAKGMPASDIPLNDVFGALEDLLAETDEEHKHSVI